MSNTNINCKIVGYSTAYIFLSAQHYVIKTSITALVTTRGCAYGRARLMREQGHHGSARVPGKEGAAPGAVVRECHPRLIVSCRLRLLRVRGLLHQRYHRPHPLHIKSRLSVSVFVLQGPDSPIV